MDKKRIPLELLLLFSVFVIATCGLIYELVAEHWQATFWEIL